MEGDVAEPLRRIPRGVDAVVLDPPGARLGDVVGFDEAADGPAEPHAAVPDLRQEEAVQQARRVVLEHGAEQRPAVHRGAVAVRVGDGYRGWPERAPFDRIVLTAAPRALPEGLLAQLADGGRLVAPVGETSERADDDFEQRLVCITRRGEAFDEVDLCGVRFVPMVRRDPECLN